MASRSPAHPTSHGSGWGSLLGWALCIGLTAAGLRNALATEPGLERMALDAACAGTAAAPAFSSPAPRPGKGPAAPPPCRLRPARWESGPVSRNLELEPPGGGSPVRVRCQREHIALGDYRCTAVP